MENIVSLDLELNQLNNQPKIIQIGLTVAHLPTRKIIESKSIMVNPGEGITEYISTLTGITDYQVKDAPNIQEAYQEMCAYLKKFNTHRMPIVWGNGDVWAIKKEVGTIGDEWPFGWREMDVKTLVQAIAMANNGQVQGGLAKSMSRYGLRFQGRKHNAEDDSKNTMLMYFKILDILKGV